MLKNKILSNINFYSVIVCTSTERFSNLERILVSDKMKIISHTKIISKKFIVCRIEVNSSSTALR